VSIFCAQWARGEDAGEVGGRERVGAQRSEGGRPARSAGEVVDQHGEGNMAAWEEECGLVVAIGSAVVGSRLSAGREAQFSVYNFSFQKLSS
jgi:hypothetical protein